MTLMLRYGSLDIDPPLILAPMAGVTDRQFRLILRRLGGVGLVTMEFVSSEGLTRGNQRTLKLMRFSAEERPISIQIYGSDPERMAQAAEIVEQSGADACDINMGCPANKVLKGCAGCSLMDDLELARKIIERVRRAIRIPLTVKFRTGVRDERASYIELGRICEGAGAEAVALHARTAKQMFRGNADWSHISLLKQELSIPVIGNGDVNVAADALRMIDQTGCDGVMIGRASMKNPWIYRQIVDLVQGREPQEPSVEDRRDLILRHYRLLMEQEEEDTKFTLHKLRTFTGWYTHGLIGGKRLRMQINALTTPQAFFDAVEEFFEQALAAA
jgi:nifR3 family TIM-barrel protein